MIEYYCQVNESPKRYEVEWCPQHGYPLPCPKCGGGEYEYGLRVGRKEVIEWIENHKTEHFIDPFLHTPRCERWMSAVNSDDWKAKLKEWGI